jgi:GNAT superfamily N-acetyltransferase
MAINPEPARPDEWLAAFRLMFRRHDAADRERYVNNALVLLEAGELDPEGVLVLRGAEGLVGALTCLPLPGALALVWPPQCLDGPRKARYEDRLLAHAASWLRGRGIKLAQTLFPPHDLTGADALERNQFVHLTHLWYLRRTSTTPLPTLGTIARLEYFTADNDPARFADTMLHSYEGTLDCPEINDTRTLDEILTGLRSQGSYDPANWWLATCDGRPVGVLVAAMTPETGERDVAYVGIVPEARRRGFGREIMLRVLKEAFDAGISGVTLSVDGRNDPAWKLYRELGFESVGRREVYLAIWR